MRWASAEVTPGRWPVSIARRFGLVYSEVAVGADAQHDASNKMGPFAVRYKWARPHRGGGAGQ